MIFKKDKDKGKKGQKGKDKDKKPISKGGWIKK